MTVESASYNAVTHAVTHAVTLGLASCALHVGDRVAVQWHDVEDATGAMATGQTPTLIAR